MAEDKFVIKLRNDGKILFSYIAITQILGVWLITRDLNYMTQNMNLETFQLPKVHHNNFDKFVASLSLSITASLVFIFSLALLRMRKPYREKAFQWFRASLGLSIISLFFELAKTIFNDRSIMAILGYSINIAPILISFKYLTSKKLKKWSYLPEREEPNLKDLE